MWKVVRVHTAAAMVVCCGNESAPRQRKKRTNERTNERTSNNAKRLGMMKGGRGYRKSGSGNVKTPWGCKLRRLDGPHIFARSGTRLMAAWMADFLGALVDPLEVLDMAKKR